MVRECAGAMARTLGAQGAGYLRCTSERRKAGICSGNMGSVLPSRKSTWAINGITG